MSMAPHESTNSKRTATVGGGAAAMARIRPQRGVLLAQGEVVCAQLVQLGLTGDVKPLFLTNLGKDLRRNAGREEHVLEASFALQHLLRRQLRHLEVSGAEPHVEMAACLVCVALDCLAWNPQLRHWDVLALLRAGVLHKVQHDLPLVTEPIHLQMLTPQVYRAAALAMVDPRIFGVACGRLGPSLKVEARPQLHARGRHQRDPQNARPALAVAEAAAQGAFSRRPGSKSNTLHVATAEATMADEDEDNAKAIFN
eukprot:CAMPEP_0177300448 /NCGR_PEP_ID=MMETSP0368-20130122/4553_1 /TAXON_ID=447022 ORGANISM="Scrippsiella hangoei-like, Strain SHHI-4" /NCGR_SAMPLE_ID=MMETSP0368 /ASSEMBLY_ACC=CAM_ASM_000363 /LENGTH=254 /DNA_ID=CAMNT_0018758825 /DNA_START=80 /DNA_END=845 /DNA_ORIENTATION=+